MFQTLIIVKLAILLANPLNYAMIMLINHIMIVNQFEHTMVRYWQFEHDTTIIS